MDQRLWDELQKFWQRGLALPISGGDNDDPPPPAPNDPDPEPEPAPVPPGATPPTESFINPADLPPEIKPHWSRMHRAYTKKLEEFKGAADKAALIDRFWSDPAFARSSIEQWAQQQGVALTFGDGATTTVRPTTTGAAGVPADFIAAVEAELPPELKWMARPLAASTWKAQGHLIAPFIKETRAKEASSRTAAYDELAEELTATAPGWEAHEDEMAELLDFLRGTEMRSRRWGSKLQLLHGLVTGNASATRYAVRRMGDAARNRTVTGVPGRSTAPNIAERVRGAKTDQEAWKLAAEHAVEELKSHGVAVP